MNFCSDLNLIERPHIFQNNKKKLFYYEISYNINRNLFSTEISNGIILNSYELLNNNEVYTKYNNELDSINNKYCKYMPEIYDYEVLYKCTSSIDNTITENKKHKEDIYDYYASIIYNLTRDDIIEDGLYSESEKFVLKLMDKDTPLVMQVLSKAILKYFYDDKLLISILDILSGFNNNILKENPIFKILVVCCLSNQNVFVKERALKFFENSGTKEDIIVLENVCIKESWLNEYREEVIAYLKG